MATDDSGSRRGSAGVSGDMALTTGDSTSGATGAFTVETGGNWRRGGACP